MIALLIKNKQSNMIYYNKYIIIISLLSYYNIIIYLFRYQIEHRFCHLNKRDFLANCADLDQHEGQKVYYQNNGRCKILFDVIFGKILNQNIIIMYL